MKRRTIKNVIVEIFAKVDNQKISLGTVEMPFGMPGLHTEIKLNFYSNGDEVELCILKYEAYDFDCHCALITGCSSDGMLKEFVFDDVTLMRKLKLEHNVDGDLSSLPDKYEYILEPLENGFAEYDRIVGNL